MTLNENQKIWDAIRQNYVPDNTPTNWGPSDVLLAHVLDELTSIRLLLTQLCETQRAK